MTHCAVTRRFLYNDEGLIKVLKALNFYIPKQGVISFIFEDGGLTPRYRVEDTPNLE
jgi:hypothetical protein